ncbi:MAG: S8/S53 family peptidase [Candidatus Babeliales bacterium]
MWVGSNASPLLFLFFFTIPHVYAHQEKPHVVLIDTDSHCSPQYATHHHTSRALILSQAPEAIIHHIPFITQEKKTVQSYKQLVRDIQKIPEPIVLFAGSFDEPMSHELRAHLADVFRELCAHAWMVIAPAGNNNIWQRKPQLAYPAAYEGVVSVGSFGCAGKNVYIAPFSQYTPQRGPLFLLPGIRITPGPGQQPTSGTSVSAALMTGFIARVHMLFGSLFTKQHLMHVLRICSVKMDTDNEWRTHGVHGILDMRYALRLLQLLYAYEQRAREQSLHWRLHTHFERLVQIAESTLLESVCF